MKRVRASPFLKPKTSPKRRKEGGKESRRAGRSTSPSAHSASLPGKGGKGGNRVKANKLQLIIPTISFFHIPKVNSITVFDIPIGAAFSPVALVLFATVSIQSSHQRKGKTDALTHLPTHPRTHASYRILLLQQVKDSMASHLTPLNPKYI